MDNQISEITIDYKASILSAIKQMDTIKRKLLIVLKEGRFFSLVSIGDIQRAIIKNTHTDSPIKNIIRSNIKIASDSDSFNSIKKMMIQLRIEFMPVIDKQNKIKKVYYWNDVIGNEFIGAENKLHIPAVIMAGGRGTRLKPITNIIPKALVPIGEKPILEIIIEKLAKSGIKEFYISVNYKHEMIRQFINSIEKNKYNIQYIQEEKPLGTAGSLHLLDGKINSTFIVSNCDILIDQDYSEVYKYHKENDNELTIVSALLHYPIPYGTIETTTNGKLKSFKEKPEITYQVNTGMYILEPHLLHQIPKDSFFDITQLIDKIQKQNRKVGVYPVSNNSWTDIGKWKDYQKLF